MPLLSRKTRPLLTRVNGKAHASSDDHEEESRTIVREEWTEEELNADPISSDDEAQPPPAPSPTSQQAASSKLDRPTQTSKPGNTASRKGGKSKRIQLPRTGSFEKGRAHKARVHAEEEKENRKASPSSSAEKRKAQDPYDFGMAYQSASKRHKPAPRTAYTKNLHAPAPVGKKRAYGGRSAKDAVTYSNVWQKPGVKDEDDDSDSLLDRQLAEITRTLDPQDTKSETRKLPSSPAKAPRPNLLASLGSYIQRSEPNLDPNASGTSTPLSSMPGSDPATPRDSLRALEEYVADLPEDDLDSKCALCQEPVDPDFSSQFWIGKDRTVRNQTKFCKEHKIKSAQAEYRAKGFPPIDWQYLPRRIAKFHPALVEILRNEKESQYRRIHADKLVSGKAAALPSRRKDKSASELERELFQDSPTSTGYYGPRGKRLMMETITSDLSDTIREVSAADPVVGRSGFAVFLQAVLVPELTVLLVMEDLGGVSVGVAEEAIRESGELGALLNEEVDDEVRVESDEEPEGDEDVEGDDEDQ